MISDERHLPMNKSDHAKNSYMLRGSLAKRGFVRWFHFFTGIQRETGERRSFFIEYQILNPSLGKEQPVLGQYPYFKKRGIKPSYVLIKAGALPDADGSGGTQLNAFYPISSLRAADNPFVFQVEDCFYSETHIEGYVDVTSEEACHRSFMTDAGCIEWNLEVHKAVACNMGFITGPFCTAAGALADFWHAEGVRTFYRGWISLNGVRYEAEPESCYGYADKNWGKRANHPLLLLSSAHLISRQNHKEYKHSSLVVTGCFPKLLFIPLKRRLMIQLTHMGEEFEFHFARISNISKCKWKIRETNRRYIWHIKAHNKNALIKISLSCTKAQLMKLLYEGPDGELPDEPILCGGNGIGTVEIYRKSDSALELLDTLGVEEALCMYQA